MICQLKIPFELTKSEKKEFEQSNMLDDIKGTLYRFICQYFF